MADQDNHSQYLDVTDLEVTEKNIYYSRPATVFAAVAASIFTIIGVLGELAPCYDCLKVTARNGKKIKSVRYHIEFPSLSLPSLFSLFASFDKSFERRNENYLNDIISGCWKIALITVMN